MGAEYCLHIKTSDISEEDMEGFFYNHMGSKYDPFTQMLNEIGEETWEKIKEDINNLPEGTSWDPESLNKYPGAKEAWEKWQKKSDELHQKYQVSKGWDALYDKFSDLPRYDVGECSFLKAQMTGDNDFYIPSLIQICNEVIDEGVIITDDIINQIEEKAKNATNSTQYKVYGVDELLAWMKGNKGEFVFSIAW